MDYVTTGPIDSGQATEPPEAFLSGETAQKMLTLLERPPLAIGDWGGTMVYTGLLGESGKAKLESLGLGLAGVRQYFRNHRGFSQKIPFELFARATHLAHWFHETRYCAGCGQALVDSAEECARVCSGCNRTFYPRINPAIIVAVLKGKQLLLARNAARAYSFRSILAGFCEAGESLEQTVAREVREESGVEITNIRYVDSQSWPFSQSLMLGFHADYAGGELRPDAKEIIDVDWFDLDNLPETPPPPSLAWKLIEAAKRQTGTGQS